MTATILRDPRGRFVHASLVYSLEFINQSIRYGALRCGMRTRGSINIYVLRSDVGGESVETVLVAKLERRRELLNFNCARVGRSRPVTPARGGAHAHQVVVQQRGSPSPPFA